MELSSTYGASVVAALIMVAIMAMAASLTFWKSRDIMMTGFAASMACLATFLPYVVLKEYVFTPRAAEANAGAVARAYGVKTSPELLRRVMVSREPTYIGYRWEGSVKVMFEGLVLRNRLTVFSTAGEVVDPAV